MEDLNQFVPDVRFEKIPIRNIVSNQEYQRNLSQKHIRRTVANFDLLQVNPVKVSRRDGINYVLTASIPLKLSLQFLAPEIRQFGVWFTTIWIIP